MCNHLPLAENSDGFILWCQDCQLYSLHFNTLIMTLDEDGFHQFKQNISSCYTQNQRCPEKRHCRNILFDTKLEGMKLCFSLNDIGSLLVLLQLAELNHYEMKYFA